MNSVSVREDGCILLGRRVSVDGFSPGAEIRIQTHAHHDHLKDLERSKGIQKVMLSEGTFDLLVAEYNDDLPYRNNFEIIPEDGEFREFEGVEIAFFSSGHMVGSVMPVVRYKDEGSYCYSSDFSWPLAVLPENIEVLVLDATHGNPEYQRNYSEEDVIRELNRLISERLEEGRTIITGHRGRLHAAAQISAEYHSGPYIASLNAFKTFDVFMKHRGFDINVVLLGSEEANEIANSGVPHIVLCEFRDRRELDQLPQDRRVYLTPFMVPRQEPISEKLNGITRVALTDHADFQGTVDLVRQINPKRVITDSTKTNNLNGERLSEYIRNELNIDARNDVLPKTREWGRH